MIYESGIITATDNDLLSQGRLNAMPQGGRLILDFLSNLNDATNYWLLTVQQARGRVPVDSQRIPGSNPSLAGVLDDRQILRVELQVVQGGHVTVQCVETGTAILAWRAVLM